MPRLKRLTAKQIIPILLEAGFYLHHTRGSHVHLRHSIKTHLRVVIPQHNRVLAPKTIKSIIFQAELDTEALLQFFN
ncbi:MAG: type II toxin-antitoxin system HicA family toxin [Candidatus Taylorbacteria bacterium]